MHYAVKSTRWQHRAISAGRGLLRMAPVVDKFV